MEIITDEIQSAILRLSGGITPSTPRVLKSIEKIEKYRQVITNRLIKGTIGRMRVFNMTQRIKVGKLKIAEFAIVDDCRLYSFGGYSDSD